MSSYTEIVLRERPKGEINERTFEKRTRQVPSEDDLQSGEVLIKVEYVSVDPAMRGWLNDSRSYVPPVPIGDRMRAGGVGQVVASKSSKFTKGHHVFGSVGFGEYAVLKEGDLQGADVPEGFSPVESLGLFGMTAMTAYFGMLDIGNPQPGETVVVSGAAGATGSVAGQIAKLKGCRVIGIAGDDEKLRWLREELNFDGTVNYKDKDWRDQLKKLTPKYINVFFDNVGGEILEAAISRAAPFARMVICGAISQYNDPNPVGPRNMFNIIAQRIKMQGFIIFDFMERYPEAQKQLADWASEGKLKSKMTVRKTGIEGAPDALKELFSGANTGKLVVQVDKSSKL